MLFPHRPQTASRASSTRWPSKRPKAAKAMDPTSDLVAVRPKVAASAVPIALPAACRTTGAAALHVKQYALLVMKPPDGMNVGYLHIMPCEVPGQPPCQFQPSRPIIFRVIQRGREAKKHTVKRIREAQVFGLVLGTVVARLRQQRSWTQSQLATSVGLSQPVISRIEAGKVQPDAFVYGKLAAAFGLSVEALDRQVHEAMAATKRAAEAVSDGDKSWDEVLGLVGMLGLVGLVIFAVAALVDEGGAKIPRPKA